MTARELWPIILAELFKVWRARLGRVAILTAIIGTALPVALIALLGDERVTTFPSVVAQLFIPSLTLLTGISSILLAISSWGEEFEYGTARTVLSRRPARWQFALGKTTALAVAVVTVILAAVGTEALVATVSHLIQVGGEGTGPHLRSLARVMPRLVAVWWLMGMVYVGLVSLATVGGRSSAVGMAAGLGLFIGDFLLSGLGSAGSVEEYGTYSIINNAFGLITSVLGDSFESGSGAPFPEMAALALPEPTRALGVLILYTAATLLMAYLLLQHRDLT